MAEPFKALVSESTSVVVRLSGPINEHSEIEVVKVRSDLPLEVDLSGLTSLNSTGIRVFRNWSQMFVNDEISFSYCPKAFVDQLNMIFSLVPERARVISFYVPYCSDSSGEEKLALYVSGDHYMKENGKIVFRHPKIKDSKGKTMALDVLPKYFGFLSRHF